MLNNCVFGTCVTIHSPGPSSIARCSLLELGHDATLSRLSWPPSLAILASFYLNWNFAKCCVPSVNVTCSNRQPV